MQTLSYGYLQPQNGDTGDVFYGALAQDINQVNSHNHDGSNSAPLATQTVSLFPGWSAAPVGGGLYYQTVTLPGALTYNNCDMWFKLSTGELIYPTITQQSFNSFNIYCNDPSQSINCYFR